MPPVDPFLTPSSWVKSSSVVLVRVTLTTLNWMRESVTSPVHGAGVWLLSGLVARKSLFSALIWLLICAFDTFCSAVL